LNICSELSFLSFDTESLNKILLTDIINSLSNNFISCFGNEYLSKISYGIQHLFTIGLVDTISKKNVLEIFKKYFPTNLYVKLHKYTTKNSKTLNCNINWNFFKSTLEPLNLDECADELTKLFNNCSLTESNIKIFHISNNDNFKKITEPSIQNTSKMVKHFIIYIYQRNILASLIKYILLKPYITKFQTSKLTSRNKGIFVSMKKRLEEIIYETVLTAFNGSNYDNYLICNALILLKSQCNMKLSIFKKGSSVSTILLKFQQNVSSKNFFQKYPKKNLNNKKKISGHKTYL
jgi:hypothetical protein